MIEYYGQGLHYSIILIQYFKVLILSWFRFIPFHWFDPKYQEKRREERNRVTGKHLLIAVKGDSILHHQRDLVRELIIKFVDLNIKSIILASKDVSTCIGIWDELSSKGIDDGPQEPFDDRRSFDLPGLDSIGGFFGSKTNRSKLKVFFQPIDLFDTSESSTKFADTVRKHDKKITLSYIVTIGLDGTSIDPRFLGSISGIVSRNVTLVQVMNDLKTFFQPKNPDPIKVTKVFFGRPFRFKVSIIPRLPSNPYQGSSFKTFFEDWIYFIFQLVREIDISTAAQMVIDSCLGQQKMNADHHILNYYGRHLKHVSLIEIE